MSLKSLVFTLSAVGLAVHLLARARETVRPAGPGPDLRDAQAGVAGTGAESPNPAERLQQTHEGGAYAGVGDDLPGGNTEVGLFPGPAPARDPEAITPGLPDFLRGA